MSQSSTIAGFLLIGFLVYIVQKGELSAYKNVLFGPASPSAGGATSPNSGVSGFAGIAEQAISGIGSGGGGGGAF
jgi:hypothetical protein